MEDDDGATAADSVSVTVVSASVVELTVSVFGEGTVQTAGQYSLECDVPHLCHAVVPDGANVVLEALPMSGYAIDRWTGCDSASNDTCTVATNRDRLVSVYFLSTEPLQLKDDVVVFDADRVDEIEDFDIDSGLLIMRTDADISDLQIDDVIVSSIIGPPIVSSPPISCGGSGIFRNYLVEQATSGQCKQRSRISSLLAR